MSYAPDPTRPQGSRPARVRARDLLPPLAPPNEPLPDLRGSPTSLEPLLGRWLTTKYMMLIAVWGLAALFFWTWWLRPEHVVNVFSYVILTSAFGWLFFLQLYFIMLFFSARVPAARLEVPRGARVAMIVTKTPSEPLEVLQTTLTAMLDQTLPHDTWLADEDPTPETIAWCEAHGVKISTRKGVAEYHRSEWPRRTRCKEGNLAYFYDHYGYEQYDYVAQLDADHVPTRTYLEEMIRPFADPEVGYVTAPSICSSNAPQSWAARSRLDTEALFHGVIQAGYAGHFAPVCIGSHYAVRTSALRAVGGLGPELAEDHSTSLILTAGGWRGVHAMDAIAHGEGPGTISDMITQEFQWSRSLVTILLLHSKNYFGNLPFKLKCQFLFVQLWYPLSSLLLAMLFTLPLFALLTDTRYAAVTYPAFLGHILPTLAIVLYIVYEVRRDGLLRPRDAKVLSWEKALYESAKWPWTAWGCLLAVRDVATGKFVDFRITPKGSAVQSKLPVRVLLPYFLLCAASVAVVLGVEDARNAAGFYILALINGFVYFTLFAVIVIQHRRESDRPIWRPDLAALTQGAAVVVLAGMIVTAGWSRGLQSLYYLSVGMEPFRLVQVYFRVSGAGSGDNAVHYEFSPGWAVSEVETHAGPQKGVVK